VSRAGVRHSLFTQNRDCRQDRLLIKMVLICAYPGCLSRRKRKQLRMLARTHSGVVSFHKFPISNPSLLKLWLIALRLDINTPINLLKLKRVCSDHFSPDDFTNQGEDRIVLTSSAVPMLSHSTEVCEQRLCMCPFYLKSWHCMKCYVKLSLFTVSPTCYPSHFRYDTCQGNLPLKGFGSVSPVAGARSQQTLL